MGDVRETRRGFAMTRLAVFLPLLAVSPAPAGDLKAGAAAVKITPPVGMPMAGYYSARAAEGVHDDLFAKALVIEKDGAKAALVALDLISTPRATVEEARRLIGETTGVRGADAMISATHAHTGPVLLNRSTRDAALGGNSDLTRDYNAGLPAKIAEAVRRAELALAPARAAEATGQESSIAFNRRFHMKDGTVGWNPGKLNPNILKPAGMIDPEVPFVYFEAADRRPIATYVNYAVHLDNVGGMKFSADMPATLAQCLSDYKGPGMVTLFTAGCCGDINHIDVHWAEKQGGFDNAARMGIILAGEVLRSWPRLEPVKDGALRSKSVTVRLDLPPVSAEDVARAREVIARRDGPKSGQPTFLESVKAFQVLDVAAREGRPHEVEVQVVALGDDLAWVSLPGEIFVELGLAIKQDSPFTHTIIVELANGAIGYIPSRRAYAQGNYEVVSARCAEGSGERLVDAAVGLLKGLHREATSAKGAAH
jgi:hypothetical protein